MLSHFQNRPDSLDESGEEQPLLLASNDYKSRSRRYFDTPLVVKEIYFILGYSWPLLVTYLVGTANKLVDAWFLGRLGAHGLYQPRNTFSAVHISILLKVKNYIFQ